jgi:thiamine kinase-like enzyme
VGTVLRFSKFCLKSLAPTLAVIVGKSIRTVERYLADNSQLNPTDDGFRKQLEQALKAMKKLQSTQPLTDAHPLKGYLAARQVLELLQAKAKT